jgi:hypothetical protein
MERDYKAHEREHAKYGVLEEAEVRGEEAEVRKDRIVDEGVAGGGYNRYSANPS